MRKYFSAGVFLLSFFFFSAFGQDIHFSQSNLTPLLINPAQAGAYKSYEMIANYKSQWTSISPHAYKTAMLSGDMRILQKGEYASWLASGINLSTDKAGDGNMQTTQANLSFGYHAMINDKSTLGGALLGGYALRSIDYTKLIWDEQYVNGAYDPNASSNEPVGDNKFGYPDFGLGILYQFNRGQMYSSTNDMLSIHTGLALSHLNAPAYSYYGSDEKLYMKITGHADAMIGVENTNLVLCPGFIYMEQGPSREFLPSMFFRYMLREQSKFTGFIKGSSLVIGSYFRLKDAFIPTVQLEIAEYTIGISYDMNLSGLKSATSIKGGFEIALRYSAI